MKAGWQIKELGGLCDILDSKRKPVTKRDRVGGQYPYYGATGILDYVESYIFDEKLILIGEDGAKWGAGENTAFSAEGKYWVNNHAHVIRPHRQTALDNWLIYFLNYSDISKYVSGLTVPKLNQAKLCEIRVPVAPLPEQHRIVAILDEAFAGIATTTANAERNLNNARELFKSHLQSVLTSEEAGWRRVKLGDLCTRITDGSHNPPKGIAHSNYLMLSSKNVFDDRIILDKPRYLRQADFEAENRRTDVHVGDVLLTIVGTVGRVAVVSEELPQFTLQRSVAVLKNRREVVTPRFLMRALQNIALEINKEARGVAQKGIYLGQLKSLGIFIPPIPEQHRIVAILDALSTTTNRMESIYQQKLSALNELKQSVLHQAFSGQLH